MGLLIGFLLFLAIGASFALLGGILDRGHQIYRGWQWQKFKTKHGLN